MYRVISYNKTKLNELESQVQIDQEVLAWKALKSSFINKYYGEINTKNHKIIFTGNLANKE
jgi:hypothetical protein